MIKKYGMGKVIRTEAVVQDYPYEEGNCPYFSFIDNKLVFEMAEDDVIYGLGEALRGLNKRGWKYTSWCADEPNQDEDKLSLYGAHNFILIDGSKSKVGFFLDTPTQVTFDIGYEKMNLLQVSMPKWDVDIYVIEGNSCQQIVKEFRQLIGTPYMAPLWAFGYQQSRWSYPTTKDVLEVVEKYTKLGIPLECVYLDIDYMEDYKDFTIDAQKFPNFSSFVQTLKSKNIHLIPIIDAGVKIEKGYSTYEEGLKNGYFCVDKDGQPFVAAVWPGLVHFPDFLNKKAREWFGNEYQTLISTGIDGFWNDMNEPAIFYTPERLAKAISKISSFQGNADLNLHKYFELSDCIRSLPNNMLDYEQMYHNIDGKLINHKDVHNLYGYNMTRSASEALVKLVPDRRILLFSRASYIGMHRYGGIWTGDNKSWWSHLEMNIKMMPNLNMVGFLYSGADTGGFGANVTEDLLLRWLSFSIFTPLLRNHSSLGTRKQELYEFDSLEVFRNFINIRQALIPYLYSEYMKCCQSGDIIFKPLAFVYPNDEVARMVEDQLLVGDSIMIAPVYKQNAKGRYVYLPESMKMLKFKSLTNYEEIILEKGHHFINVSLKEVVIFIRINKILPLATPKMRVEDINLKELKVFSYAKNKAHYEYYLDDGISLIPNGKLYDIYVEKDEVEGLGLNVYKAESF